MGKYLSKINAGSVYIIAEVGVNHNGNLERALQCVDQAAICGADAVKFQTFDSKKLVTRHAQKAAYQAENTGISGSQLEMLQKLELSHSEFINIKNYCDKKGIDFLSTPFDEESAQFLDSIEVNAFKVSSGDLNNTPFLQQLNQYGRPIILSTGMSDMNEIRESMKIFTKSNVSLLHCTSDYPAPLEDVNLLAMKAMADEFGRITGYSDHTDGIEVAVAAVAMGAKIIEKHFTLDRSLPGPDHQASLEPSEFATMIEAIRRVEKVLGNGIKRCMPSEESTKAVARKSLVAGRSLQAGDTLQEKDIHIKRPGTGIEPKFYTEFIGKQLTRDIVEDQLLSWEDLR
ncbi:N-acetylneuraminate synthase [Paenibacillus polymyxa]|uniref:N-acetylneuraminate synthase n=1 Tax=Paenibacillus polymyxa TaxID=1406 RepID=UPI001BEA7BC0|nr:N-acetylneuraminate synthase [Paenibacillus polymyxa]MBT2282009.1 N-acetylneuraminate synthase [Paenibacillus polymyxa]